MLGFSSRHSSLRENAADALDRLLQRSAAAEWEKDSDFLTVVATSDQLPLFVHSRLFPALTATLVQLSRSAPPSPSSVLFPTLLHRVLSCSACERELLSVFPVVDDTWVAASWASDKVPLSLAYLAVKGFFHPGAVDVLFDVLQTHPSFRSTEVGLEMVRAHLTDAARAASTAMKAGKGETVAKGREVYESALQVMDAQQLGQPVLSQPRKAQPIAQAVKARKR